MCTWSLNTSVCISLEWKDTHLCNHSATIKMRKVLVRVIQDYHPIRERFKCHRLFQYALYRFWTVSGHILHTVVYPYSLLQMNNSLCLSLSLMILMFLKSTGQFLCRMFLSLSFFHVSSATEMVLPIHYIIEILWYKLVIGDINFYHLVNMLPCMLGFSNVKLYLLIDK